MVDKLKQIELKDSLALLESSDYTKVLYFVDKNESLNSFFTYKGKILEINKLKIKLLMAKTDDDKKKIINDIKSSICHGAKFGEWLVFTTDKNSDFNSLEFFKTLDIECKDYSWFDPKNFTDRKYFVDNNILLKELDVDNFGNKGCWRPNEKFKMVFLSNSSDEEISTLQKNNNNPLFEFVYVK